MKCPGGDHEIRPSGQICCDPCWNRIPAKLSWDGGTRTWRRRIPAARMVRDYRTIELIHDAVRAWLHEHREL